MYKITIEEILYTMKIAVEVLWYAKSSIYFGRDKVFRI